MEEIRFNVNGVEVHLFDDKLGELFLIYTDYGDEESNGQNYHDIKKLFDLIDDKYYEQIKDVDLTNIYISGNLWKELYRFKNLKNISYEIYEYYEEYQMDNLIYRYNNNIEIDESYNDINYLTDIFEFYKNHQDDPFYKNDLFDAGLNEVDFYNVVYLSHICIGEFSCQKNKNLCEMIKLLFDDMHRNDKGSLIFKNKFDKFYVIDIIIGI